MGRRVITILQIGSWAQDWALGLALTVATVMAHILGLGLVGRAFERLRHRFAAQGKPSLPRLVATAGPVVALIFGLHALEAVAWAFVYVRIGAMPDLHLAVSYSVDAMATYGHAQLYLAPEWRLLGAIQALNGMLVFGLTVAFLATMFRRLAHDAQP